MADVATGEEEEERKIIVAVDESEESLHALRWCLDNIVAAAARRARDTLVLLYARPLPPVHSLLDGVEYLFSEDVTASMDRCSKELARSVLGKAENVCQSYSNIKVEAKECGGDARDVICDMVERLGADILVVGSHGYGLIKRTLIGSVSDYCARNAKCPVIIVKRQ